MKKTIIFICATLLTFSTNSYGFYLFGSGARICKDWISDADTDSYLITTNKSWVSGYLTGFNAGMGKEMFYNDGIDVNTTYDYIIFYCRSHPEDSPPTAIADMLIKIREQTKP